MEETSAPLKCSATALGLSKCAATRRFFFAGSLVTPSVFKYVSFPSAIYEGKLANLLLCEKKCTNKKVIFPKQHTRTLPF